MPQNGGLTQVVNIIIHELKNFYYPYSSFLSDRLFSFVLQQNVVQST